MRGNSVNELQQGVDQLVVDMLNTWNCHCVLAGLAEPLSGIPESEVETLKRFVSNFMCYDRFIRPMNSFSQSEIILNAMLEAVDMYHMRKYPIAYRQITQEEVCQTNHRQNRNQRRPSQT